MFVPFGMREPGLAVITEFAAETGPANPTLVELPMAVPLIVPVMVAVPDVLAEVRVAV